jgi:hypothetical protein
MQARVGSFVKTTTVEAEGERHVLIREWVAYDLAQGFVDRRIGLGDRPDTPTVEEPATRSAPSLRFLYTRDRVAMWNPGVAEKCGTPWVDMPESLIEQTTGFRLEDLVVIEPEVMLNTALGEPRLVENNERGTVFELPIPASAVVPASAVLENPELGPRLDRETLQARVSVGRDRAPIRISVDLTPALEALTGIGDDEGRMILDWSLDRATPKVDSTFPENVADSACMS